MRMNRVTCDNCGRDLTETGFSREYYLSLSLGAKVNSSNVSMGGILPKPIERDMDFCDLNCLREKLLLEALSNQSDKGSPTSDDAKKGEPHAK